MTEMDARNLANQVIGLVLTHQPNVLGSVPLSSEEAARQAAKQIAAFRETLVQELQKQAI